LLLLQEEFAYLSAHTKIIFFCCDLIIEN